MLRHRPDRMQSAHACGAAGRRLGVRSEAAQVTLFGQSAVPIYLGEAWLPPTLASRSPWAARQWGWQYVFPSARRLTDPRDGVCRRPHIDIATVRRLLDAIAGEGRPVPGGTGRAVRAG